MKLKPLFLFRVHVLFYVNLLYLVPGIDANPDPDNGRWFHVILVGPDSTPYAGSNSILVSQHLIASIVLVHHTCVCVCVAAKLFNYVILCN